MIDMYLAGVSTRQVDDVSRLLWGDRMPSQTLSDKLKKVYADIDEWRGRPLEQDYPYLFMDGVWHKRCWGGSVENVSILVAVGVGMDGRREVLSVAEGMKECISMLLYIVKRLGVLFWVGCRVYPLDGPLLEFGKVACAAFDLADAARGHAERLADLLLGDVPADA